MGFYIRKSVKVGPFRFNLSKSGVGVSAGIKGLRFGVGPQGNYVHMGSGGLYYRKTISSVVPDTQKNPIDLIPVIPSETHAPMEEIESSDIFQIVDSSSQELLNELNQKRKALRLFPILLIFAINIFALAIYFEWTEWLLGLLFMAIVVGLFFAHRRDVLVKTTVLFYDLDSEMEGLYEKLHSYAESLGRSSAVWHVESQGKVYDRKYHAGANTLISRKPTYIRKAEPPCLKTNIATVAIGVGRQVLHFFPDRVLIYDKAGVGAVNYKELCIKVNPIKFVEDGGVPRDTSIVSRTWRYVNKAGGPDRRFSNNKELPVCLYEEILFSSDSGLNELLQISRCGVGQGFADAVAFLGKKTPKEILT